MRWRSYQKITGGTGTGRHMHLRLVAYIQRRNVHKRHAKRDRMSRLVAKHWFAMKWRYNQPLRIIARRRVENNEKLCARGRRAGAAGRRPLVFRRAIRRWLDWKYLCRRFDAQRERLDLEETLRTRLDSAECIQRNWLAYLERCAERAECLALRDRDARREELRTPGGRGLSNSTMRAMLSCLTDCWSCGSKQQHNG